MSRGPCEGNQVTKKQKDELYILTMLIERDMKNLRRAIDGAEPMPCEGLRSRVESLQRLLPAYEAEKDK